MNRLLLILVPLCLLSILFFVYSTDFSTEQEITLILTGILQGNIEPFPVTAGESGTEPRLAGGLSFLKARVDSLRSDAKQRNSPSLLLSVGDDLSGTSQSFYTQGRSVIDCLNLLGLDALSIGNREFDYGRNVLQERLSEATFPVLAANMTESDASLPRGIEAWRQFELAGIRVGVVGMAPPTTPREAKTSNIEGLVFTDEQHVVDTILPMLREAACDLRIVITQRDMEKEWDSLLPLKDQADIIIALDYSQKQKEALRFGDKSWIVPYHGLSKGAELRTARLRIDRVHSKILSVQLDFFPIGPTEGAPNMKMAQCIADYARRIDRIKGRVIGQNPQRLERPYGNSTSLGNLICDIMRSSASAEIALQNSGSIRADLSAGPVNVGNIYDMLPFDNDIVSMKLRGSQLRGILEHAMADRRGLLQISGGHYAYRIINDQEWKLEAFQIAGQDLVDEQYYRVATNDFMAGGGGGYRQFQQGTDSVVHGPLRQTVTDWIERNGLQAVSAEPRFVALEAETDTGE